MRRRPGPPIRHTKPPGKAVVKRDNTEQRLEALAEEINESFRRTVEDAIAIGDMLIEAKSLLQRGEWQPWLEANFPLSFRTAQGYMQLARKSATVALIDDATSLRKTLALLAAPAAEAADEQEADVELDDADVVEESGNEGWTWAFIKEQSRPALVRIIIDYEVDIDTGKAGDQGAYKLDKLRYDVARLLDVDVPKEDRPRRHQSSSADTSTGKLDYKSARVVKKPAKQDDPKPAPAPAEDTSSPYQDEGYADESEAGGGSAEADDPWAWYEPTIEFLSDFDGAKRTFNYAKVDERELLKFLKGLGFNKSDATDRISQLRFDGVLLDDGATLYRRLS